MIREISLDHHHDTTPKRSFARNGIVSPRDQARQQVRTSGGDRAVVQRVADMFAATQDNGNHHKALVLGAGMDDVATIGSTFETPTLRRSVRLAGRLAAAWVPAAPVMVGAAGVLPPRPTATTRRPAAGSQTAPPALWRGMA
ncbi:MAG: hypothetical protein R2761_09670 [Acidimicrobiales bacterium]